MPRRRLCSSHPFSLIAVVGKILAVANSEVPSELARRRDFRAIIIPTGAVSKNKFTVIAPKGKSFFGRPQAPPDPVAEGGSFVVGLEVGPETCVASPVGEAICFAVGSGVGVGVWVGVAGPCIKNRVLR